MISTERDSRLLWLANASLASVMAGASLSSLLQGSAVQEIAQLDLGLIVKVLVSTILTTLLTVNAYFLRQTAKVFNDTVRRVSMHNESIGQLQRISEIVLTDMIVEGAGDPTIGRRKNDERTIAMLKVMLTDLRSGQRKLGAGSFSSTSSSEG